MSALIGHAKATRILAAALAKKAGELNDEGFSSEALVIVSLAEAHDNAAAQMEQAMREEATGREDMP